MGLPKDNIFFGLRLTEEQRVYVDSMIDNQLTIVNAVAGTGKTTLAVATASLLGMKLVYAFSPVEEMKDKSGNQINVQTVKYDMVLDTTTVNHFAILKVHKGFMKYKLDGIYELVK